MSLNLNRVMLAGNLTRDPQVRFFANERAVANFGLAINHRYKTKEGEQKEDTTFVDIEAWGRTAELVGQYLTKGRACYVEGRLKLDSWDDKEGQKRSKLKVVADNIQFLDSARGGAAKDGGQAASGANAADAGGQDAPPAASSAKASPPPAGDDEPPF